MIERLKLQGGYFSEETSLNLFEKNKRLSFIYGKNGSGKSTISKAVEKVAGDTENDIVRANLYDFDGNVYANTGDIYVFNEDYVSRKVKIKEEGLNSIVLLGDLVNIEDKLANLNLKIDEELEINTKLKNEANEYLDIYNEKSPKYWRTQINRGLTGNDKWAEREKDINDGKRSNVTEKVIDNIIDLSPNESLEDLKKRYAENFQLLNQIRNNGAEQIQDTIELKISYDELKVKMLLEKKIERPKLSEREQHLLWLVDHEKMDQVNDMKSEFSKETVKVCPYCLRSITSKEKTELIEGIEKVLSKEVDNHLEDLRNSIIAPIKVDFSAMEILNSKNQSKCEDLIDEINVEIANMGEAIRKKIHHPYDPIFDYSSRLSLLLNAYETCRKALQEDIDLYNDAVKKTETLKRKLADDNAAIAYYEVKTDIDKFRQAIDNQKQVNALMQESDARMKKQKEEYTSLQAQKKNIKIADEIINRGLQYVFFSKDRLRIKVEDEKYVLYSRGKSVRPINVSTGERNIIALVYFFTELMENSEVKEGYNKKLIVVIDDPVSSFDFENKIGIMSLLKAKICDILKGNQDSQVLLMTHDIQCLYDLQKIGDEIEKESKRDKKQDKIASSSRELKNKEIVQLKDANRNEYSEILKRVYEYACDEKNGDKLTIGNLMRRALEAFSSFVYKKGITEISWNDDILEQIEDEDYRFHFKNLMYRLLLNGDSHMQERTNSLENPDYLKMISDEERKRTARELICFIYLLNKKHVLAHLDGMNDVEKNISVWCAEIKAFCSYDEV